MSLSQKKVILIEPKYPKAHETLGIVNMQLELYDQAIDNFSNAVSLNGKTVKSCSLFAVQADGQDILTVEGLATNGQLHPIQKAFWNEHGLQCGFCTPGMLMTTKELLEKNPQPTDDEIRHGLEGNLCRCTGYQHIVNAVKSASRVGG